MKIANKYKPSEAYLDQNDNHLDHASNNFIGAVSSMTPQDQEKTNKKVKKILDRRYGPEPGNDDDDKDDKDDDNKNKDDDDKDDDKDDDSKNKDHKRFYKPSDEFVKVGDSHLDHSTSNFIGANAALTP